MQVAVIETLSAAEELRFDCVFDSSANQLFFSRSPAEVAGPDRVTHCIGVKEVWQFIACEKVGEARRTRRRSTSKEGYREADPVRRQR